MNTISVSMEKYDLWNKQKKALASRSREVVFREGDIWWCSLGLNLGTESFGKGGKFRRPVLVIKKFARDACIIVPLTLKEKKGSWFQEISFRGEKRWALVHQIRMIHTCRFESRLASIDNANMRRVKEKLESLLELF